jgi:uncharacterized protein YndB with AHSA1/START domain
MAVTQGSDGLELTLPSDTQVLIKLKVDAPRHLVYRAWTSPDLIKLWWGGDQGEVTSVEADLRAGGSWRYVMWANGSYWGFHGEYLEVVPDERVASTEIFENQPEAATVKKVSFTEQDGGTVLSIFVQHSSKEYRDAQVDPHWREGLLGLRDHLQRAALSIR